MYGRRPLVFCCLMLWVAVARADVVHLKDGRKLEGNITKTAEGWSVRDASGQVTNVKSSDVVRLEARANAGPDVAMSRLASLRRSVEGQSDAQKVIDRFDAFIKQYPDTPAADEAKTDLGTWRDRLNKQMVKVADKWLTQEEAAAARGQAQSQAVQARDLMLQTRFKDAGEIIDRILAVDPQQPAGLYLRGVLLHDQQQIVPARKSFDAVQAVMPNHAPTLNNIAVLSWQTRQYAVAMNNYDMAIQALPANRYLLDNVAEALHMLPAEFRNNSTVKRLIKHFNEQDNLLQSRMAKKDLYRWGSTWVSGSELDKLQAAEKKIQERIEAMEIDYQDALDRIDRYDDDIRELQNTLKRIENATIRSDSGGRMVRVPPPRYYYDTARDLQQVQADQAAVIKKAQDLRKKARSIQKEISPPRFAGQQRLIGAEGAPLPPPSVNPAADPSTRPGRVEEPRPQQPLTSKKATTMPTADDDEGKAPLGRKGLLEP